MKKLIYLGMLILGACCTDKQEIIERTYESDDDSSYFFTDSTINYEEEEDPKAIRVSEAPKKSKTERVKINLNPTQEYIKKYSKTAIEEHRIYKIPASITLAQGLLESGRGQSTLTKRDNAHFGIKPGPWVGDKKLYITKEWDKNLQKFVKVKAYFRVYPSAWWSFRNRSHFLTKTARYKPCFECKDDYKCWAEQLQKCGYATDPNYSKTLINLIQNYELYRFDKN